jgi:DNA-binding IclR family transcriptional regulator
MPTKQLETGPSVTTAATGTVSRAIQLLRVIAEADEPQTVSGLARSLGLPTSTVHRLLQLLKDHGMVAGDPSTRRYAPGHEFYRIGASLTARRSIGELARPIMQRVVDVCSETCILSTLLWSEHAMAFIEQVESTQPLRFSMPLHVRLPLVWGATGLSIVAMLSEEEVDELLAEAQPSPVQGTKLPSSRKFKQQLAEIRELGYAITERQKIADSVGIASAVVDSRGQPIGSLALTIPVSRYVPSSGPELGKLIADAAYEISRGLGYLVDPARAKSPTDPRRAKSPRKTADSGRHRRV